MNLMGTLYNTISLCNKTIVIISHKNIIYASQIPLRWNINTL